MINIGGFGHSGNTALVDFFADSSTVCPIGYNYTESAIIRSKWGLKAILSNFTPDNYFIEWSLIEDCLLGVQKTSHVNLEPPVHHDFVRNARVRKYLGASYDVAVKDLIAKCNEIYKLNSKNLSEGLSLTKDLLKTIEALAIQKTGNNDSLPMMRNDPAAANIDLLQYSTVDHHFTMIRDPGDMMYDWLTYYNHSNDLSGAKLFSKQFVKKINDFILRHQLLPNEVKSKIKIIKFEHLVKSEALRSKLYDLVNVVPAKSHVRFQPNVSEKNIGIHQLLSDQGKIEVQTTCLPALDQLYKCLPADSFIE